MSASRTNLLSVRSVAKAFGGNQVLRDVSFDVQRGEIVGLLGPNGSGKSTLLNCITGFEAVDGGVIALGGQRIERLPAHRIVRHGVARTFQLPSMPTKMSVFEVALAASAAQHGVFATLLGTPALRRAEAEARIKAEGLIDALLLGAVRDLPASALSGGQKKLLGIVCALMGEPELVLLDEPTAGVHPNLRRDLVQALKRLNSQGMTLVIVEHDMHFIRDVCSRCVVLDRGEIVASCKPDKLASNERVIQAYLGGRHTPQALEENAP
ncbi:ABC transporter ATP-binding protein [Pseudomonas putida]|uniref:ABC transporter ATP-binding protein n=1 Tax=Pseudomonas TaxID=286 RepID=UPI001059DFE9|nr:MULTISPECIES: ABC transporter ATP-binding protein [Pseudomonas]MBF8746401.1 ABC transporter ATP-binding protein [Pseudomonas monteilii]MCT8166549.1 ABC transporter ATP-binding protein [Pseudomonas sp. HD6422]MCT8185394.1 ABC transporter ATP-binding protein [Pseudomonas sp. HD6421]TDJ76473.1 ABC transporter ATP-binding protein [Pseudomonas putida]